MENLHNYLTLKLNKTHSNIGILIISFNILSFVNPLVYEYLFDNLSVIINANILGSIISTFILNTFNNPSTAIG